MTPPLHRPPADSSPSTATRSRIRSAVTGALIVLLPIAALLFAVDEVGAVAGTSQDSSVTRSDDDASVLEPEEKPSRKQPGGFRHLLRRGSFLATLVLALELMGIGSAIHAVMNTRTAQGAIAWAVSLVAVPYLAVPAYWILGRSQFEGYVVARQEGEERIHELVPDLFEQLRQPGVPEVEVSSGELSEAGLSGYRVLNRLTDFPLTRGNEVELLIDGDATFASIFEGIDRARDYVLVQFYIVKDDEIGRELKNRLIAKAREGVRVDFIYDEIGSHRLPKSYVEELRAAGVEITPFNTTQGRRNRFQLNFRNHRKIVVVDGREAWVGGHNVGDEYLGRDPRFGPWRDTHVRILGPAVLKLQFSFVEDWYWATRRSVPGLNWRPVISETRDQRVIVVPTSPADKRESGTLLFMQAITSARERLWIASPYFVPDPDLLGALQLADLKGVDVRILIPEEPDHMLVYLAAFTFVEELKGTGIEFYRYQGGFLHQKAVLLDDNVAAVGTSNLDNRSMRLNFEVMAVIADPDFAAEVERMFEADFARSRRMDPDELSRKSWWFQFKARAARLTAPIL